MDNSLNISLSQHYYNKHTNPKWYEGLTSGKPPIKWYGALVHSWDDAEHSGDETTAQYHMWVMPSGRLVVSYAETDYTHSNFDGEFDTHHKTRVINDLDDLWSMATKPSEVYMLTEFLRQCGKRLGDETMFWKVVEGDPVPF